MFRLLCMLIAISPVAEATTRRPLKSYFAKLRPIFDQEKALAAKTRSGWAITSGLIIGPHSRRYVGAFDMEFLTPRWWRKSEFDLTSPIAVYGQHVFLGYRDGSVEKVDVNTGKVEWTVQLGSYASRLPIMSGEKLFFVTIKQQLYALDFQTGEIQWFYEAGLPEYMVVSGGATPVVEGDIVYFGTSFGDVHAVNIQTGQLIWKKDPKFSSERFVDIVGDLFVYNDKLYLSRYDGVIAALSLGLSEPQLTWSEKVNGIATSSFRNGRLYVANLAGEIIAYELVNGREVWRLATGAPVSSLNILRDSLVAMGSKGRVTFINVDSGQAIWREDLYGEFSATPVVYDDNLFLFSGLGSVYGYKL